MKPTEAAALLAVASSADNRKPDAEVAKAWAQFLNGLRYEDCLTVVVAHYRTSRDWLMPADIVAGVKRLRDKRIAEYGPIPAPTHIDPDDSAKLAAWMRGAVARVGDGTMPPPAALTGPKRDVVAELGHVGHTIEETT